MNDPDDHGRTDRTTTDGTTTDGTAPERTATGLVDHCREVVERAFEYLDGEMSTLDCDRLKVHLDECESCVRQLAEDRGA